MEREDKDFEVVAACFQQGCDPQRGGQHVTKTCTGVTVIHRPSGIAVIECDERSRLRNRHKATARLQSILNLVYGPEAP